MSFDPYDIEGAPLRSPQRPAGDQRYQALQAALQFHQHCHQIAGNQDVINTAQVFHDFLSGV